MKFKDRLKIKNSFDGNLLFGAQNFNKKTGRDIHLDNIQNKSIPKYLDQNQNLKNNYINFRNCPVCNNNRYKVIFNKSAFDHVKCYNCEMIYVNPILKNEMLHNNYLNEDSYNKVLTNELSLELDRKRFNYNLDVLENYISKPGKILDVGAGPGIFVEVCKNRGWIPTAIEFNSFCVERIISLGIECITKPIEDTDLIEKSFDCITLWAVLEHLQEPKKVLQQIFNLLKPNGILIILVPNIDSLAARILHEKCVTFSGESHINFFNNKTIKEIQEQSGFKVLEIETVFSEVNTIKNYLNYNDPYFGSGGVEFNFLNPEYIHNNLMGYCLISYARKV